MSLKKVETILRHFRLEDVKNALCKQGIQGMTVSEVRGFGRQKGHREIFRSAEYVVDFMPKVKMEVVVPEHLLDAVIDTILQTARTGNVGDGKIFVLDLADAIRIRTGETGGTAICE